MKRSARTLILTLAAIPLAILIFVLAPSGVPTPPAAAVAAPAATPVAQDAVTKPAAVPSALAEPRLVLTPKPGPEPRINGARVFGVRPGSPFLFTIPATGERPIAFGAEGLPQGLRLDAATGQISGVIVAPGTYLVTLAATNRLGRDSRPFQIVCGPILALTPHMGWNSWYVWENHVTDAIMRAAADAMAESGLIDHGYQYVNIDDCWAIRPDGKDPSLLMPPAHSLEATAIVDRVMRGEQVENLETERMTKDGRILQVSVNASPVMDGGRSSDPED